MSLLMKEQYNRTSVASEKQHTNSDNEYGFHSLNISNLNIYDLQNSFELAQARI